jgi:hypothetical protein
MHTLQAEIARSNYTHEESFRCHKCESELQRIADAERRTLSQLVAIIIDDFLKGRTGKKG